MKRLKSLFQQFKSKFIQDIKKQEGAIQNVAPSVDRLAEQIHQNENIARFIFSPINVNPNTNILKANCFKPPTGLDEVSVNRFSFTDEHFLKDLGLKMQQPKKDFYGLALFTCLTIRENNFDIVYSPIEPPEEPCNKFHSDVKIGYVVEKDTPLPAEISESIRKILKKTTLYKDSNAETATWVGDKIDVDKQH